MLPQLKFEEVLQPFDYDTRELLVKLRATIDQLVRLKGAIGKANGEIYEKIFRLSELRGAVALLKTVPTRHGKFLESAGYTQAMEVENEPPARNFTRSGIFLLANPAINCPRRVRTSASQQVIETTAYSAS